MIFFIVSSLVIYQLILLLVHLAVYATLSAAFGIGSVALKVVFSLLALTFVTATLLSFRFKNAFVRWYYRFAMYWFGLVHFLFVGGVVFFFAEKLLYAHNHYIPAALIGACSFGAVFLIHLYGTLKSGSAEVTPISVALRNLPEAWRGKKVVFVSDLHLGNVRGRAFAGKVVRKIVAERPEAVFIGGDMYDGVKCDLEGLVAPFRSLRPPQGVYFVTGNHDYIRDTERGIAALRGAGVRILNDEKVDLQGIQLVGVDYRSSEHKEDFKRIIKNIGIHPAAPSIMVRHVPDHLPEAEEAGVSLGLFGHTHQGQIFPVSLLVKQQYGKFYSGLQRLQGMWSYTSSGVGTWGPPLRLGTKSEIVVITLC